jgi:hypothetical protein
MKKTILVSFSLLFYVCIYAQSVTLTPGAVNSTFNTAGNHIRLVGASQDPEITGIQTGGTLTSFGATPAGERLLRLTGAGHNGSTITAARTAINFETINAWTGSDNGAKMSFWTTTAGTTTMLERMTILDNGRVGINTQTPQSDLEVAGNSGMSVRTYGANFDSHIYGSHAGGSANSPTATPNNQVLARFEGHGFNGSYFEEGARIEMAAAETWASAENGTEMRFYTTPVNTDTPLKRMTIAGNGNVGINTANPEFSLEVLAEGDNGVAVRRFGDAPSFFGVSAGGNVNVPGPTQLDHILARFGGRGYDGTGFTNAKARIDFRSANNWTSANTGAAIDFITTSNLANTPQVNMTLSSVGNLGIGLLPSGVGERLQVSGNASKTVGGGNWVTPSDRRLKKNIVYLNSREMLEKVLSLKGANYYWIDENKDKRLQYGFIAQELKEVFPTKVEENANGYLSATYGDFDPMLVESIKALKELIDEQKAMLTQQQLQIDQLKMMVSAKDETTVAGSRSKK